MIYDDRKGFTRAHTHYDDEKLRCSFSDMRLNTSLNVVNDPYRSVMMTGLESMGDLPF